MKTCKECYYYHQESVPDTQEPRRLNGFGHCRVDPPVQGNLYDSLSAITHKDRPTCRFFLERSQAG